MANAHGAEAGGKDSEQKRKTLLELYVDQGKEPDAKSNSLFASYRTFLGLYDDDMAGRVWKKEAPRIPADVEARPALATLEQLTTTAPAVFFNEAHNSPRTRTILLQMLPVLKRQGFNYLGVETLYEDSALQSRGYPLLRDGYYSREPIFGELIRTAITLGFKVVPYESFVDGMREEQEAQNLFDRTLKKNPQPRIVVNAGYAHIHKGRGQIDDQDPMAVWFQKLAKIQVVSIDTESMLGRLPSEAILAKSHLEENEPFVLVTQAKKIWTSQPDAVDASVLFPPQVASEGRPTWLALGGTRQPYSISSDALCQNHFPCLIEARYQNEATDSVPADAYLFDRPGDNSRLYLRPGGYIVQSSAPGVPIIVSNSVTTMQSYFLKP